MELYSKIQEAFDNHPSKFEDMANAFLAQHSFVLTHLPIDIISLKPGIFEACHFILHNIILPSNSPVNQAFNEGDFTSIFNFFTHFDELIAAYQPQQHDKAANDQMKQVIISVIRERFACQQATEFVYHNNEILLAKGAALGDSEAMDWYNTLLKESTSDEIPYHVAVGAFECEKCKWNLSSPAKGIEYLRKALFQIASISLPDIAEEPTYFIDYLDLILGEFIPHIRNRKISLDQVQDCFDLVLSFHKKYDVDRILSESETYFKQIIEMYSSDHSPCQWLEYQIQTLEQAAKKKVDSESNEDFFLLNKAFKWAVELARLDKKNGEGKTLKLLAEILELAGVSAKE